MAVAAEALEAGEGSVAGQTAAEGGSVSEQADRAVTAARAGRGRRLSPEVARELRRRASRKPKAAESSRESSGGGGIPLPTPSDAVGVAGRASRAVSTPGGRHSVVLRVGFAFIAFVLALELASYLSGRYFSYSLGAGGKKLQGAAQSLGMTPSSAQKAQLRAVLPKAAGGTMPGLYGS